MKKTAIKVVLCWNFLVILQLFQRMFCSTEPNMAVFCTYSLCWSHFISHSNLVITEVKHRPARWGEILCRSDPFNKELKQLISISLSTMAGTADALDNAPIRVIGPLLPLLSPSYHSLSSSNVSLFAELLPFVRRKRVVCFNYNCEEY